MDRAALLNPRTRSPAAAKKSAGDLGNSLVPNRVAGYVDAIAGLVKPQSKSCDLTTDRLKTRRTVARRGRCNMQSLSRSAFNCYGLPRREPAYSLAEPGCPSSRRARGFGAGQEYAAGPIQIIEVLIATDQGPRSIAPTSSTVRAGPAVLSSTIPTASYLLGGSNVGSVSTLNPPCFEENSRATNQPKAGLEIVHCQPLLGLRQPVVARRITADSGPDPVDIHVGMVPQLSPRDIAA